MYGWTPLRPTPRRQNQYFPVAQDVRKMIQGEGVHINKEKVEDPARLMTTTDLLNGQNMLAQKGKKNYFLVKIN